MFSQEWAILTIVPLAIFNMALTRRTYTLPDSDEQQHLHFCTVVGGVKFPAFFDFDMKIRPQAGPPS